MKAPKRKAAESATFNQSDFKSAEEDFYVVEPDSYDDDAIKGADFFDEEWGYVLVSHDLMADNDEAEDVWMKFVAPHFPDPVKARLRLRSRFPHPRLEHKESPGRVRVCYKSLYNCASSHIHKV